MMQQDAWQSFERKALAPLGRVGIEMLLEVRDESHAQDVIQHLREKGYSPEREGNVDWAH